MKRPVILVLMTSLLASGSVLARENSNDGLTGKMARAVAERNDGNRGNDRGHDRGNDRGHDRGHDRGNDRGHDRGNDRRHDRGNDRGHDRHDRPRNDYRGYNPPRHDSPNHDRRDWNDHRRDDNRRDWDRNHDRNDHRNDHRWTHYRSDWNRHPNYWDNRRHDRADYARYRYRYGAYHAPHGYYYRTWRRGDHLPRGWYGSSYVVYDWRPYRLYSPPYGYHWVRVGNDVLLTALATGIVLDVIYDIWY
jgi:Ni/Co efflux regulator RcnB